MKDITKILISDHNFASQRPNLKSGNKAKNILKQELHPQNTTKTSKSCSNNIKKKNIQGVSRNAGQIAPAKSMHHKRKKLMSYWFLIG